MIMFNNWSTSASERLPSGASVREHNIYVSYLGSDAIIEAVEVGRIRDVTLNRHRLWPNGRRRGIKEQRSGREANAGPSAGHHRNFSGKLPAIIGVGVRHCVFSQIAAAGPVETR